MITKAKKLWKGYGMLVILLCIMLLNPIQQLLATAKSGQIAPPITETYWTEVKEAPLGSGTSADPYIIDSAEKLAYLVGEETGGYLNAFFSQTKDIDLGGKKWKPIGNITAAANSIRYNGNGHKISNMMIVDGQNHRGLFGCVWNGTIQNVNIVNPYIIGGTEVGGLIGLAVQGGIYNCHISGGYLNGDQVGGLVGRFLGYAGRMENVSSSASIYANEEAGGIIGVFLNQASNGAMHNIVKARFTGRAESEKNVGGIIGTIINSTDKSVSLLLENCHIDAMLRANLTCGGIVGTVLAGNSSVIINGSGFNGDIIGQAETLIGSMIGKCESKMTTLMQSYGIADVQSGIVYPFGADNVIWKDIYSYVRQNKNSTYKIYAKYKNVEGFQYFGVSPYINGGFPFMKFMFAVGDFLPEQDIVSYLEAYGFSQYLLDIKTLQNSTYGTDKYVELGKYPQTYVGASMNSILEGWYHGETVVDTYSVDDGISDESNVYNAYTYIDGKTYVRVPTPSVYSTAQGDMQSIYSDGSVATTNATWFKVEPVKWLILNYTEFEKGAAPIVIVEKTLTANVTWNKLASNQNLWAKTSNIRTWLNDTFYKECFNDEDSECIINTVVQTNSQSSETDGTGDSIENKVWLLSNNEVSGKYFIGATQRLASPTDFAIANHAAVANNYITTARLSGGTSYYWLRTAYASQANRVRLVDINGELGGNYVYDIGCAVRPSLTLNI